jgi:hypothetical protein
MTYVIAWCSITAHYHHALWYNFCPLFRTDELFSQRPLAVFPLVAVAPDHEMKLLLVVQVLLPLQTLLRVAEDM